MAVLSEYPLNLHLQGGLSSTVCPSMREAGVSACREGRYEGDPAVFKRQYGHECRQMVQLFRIAPLLLYGGGADRLRPISSCPGLCPGLCLLPVRAGFRIIGGRRPGDRGAGCVPCVYRARRCSRRMFPQGLVERHHTEAAEREKACPRNLSEKKVYKAASEIFQAWSLLYRFQGIVRPSWRGLYREVGQQPVRHDKGRDGQRLVDKSW